MKERGRQSSDNYIIDNLVSFMCGKSSFGGIGALVAPPVASLSMRIGPKEYSCLLHFIIKSYWLKIGVLKINNQYDSRLKASCIFF